MNNKISIDYNFTDRYYNGFKDNYSDLVFNCVEWRFKTKLKSIGFGMKFDDVRNKYVRI